MNPLTTSEMLAGGESLHVEFKSDLDDRDLVKAVACLANGHGGTLLIGVDDTGNPVGARPRHGSTTDSDRLAAMIQNLTEPALPVSARTEVVQGVQLIRIDVPLADPGPVATKDGLFTKRTLDPAGRPQCVPMTPHEIVSMGMVTRGMDYAATVARGANLADLDTREFDRFRSLCRDKGDDAIAALTDQDILKALGLAPLSDPVSLGAILLFGSESAIARWLPAAEVLFQDTRPGYPSTNERLVGPLFRVAEQLRERLDARNTVTELLAGFVRVEVPLIPSVTRREAVVNALIHRDYSALGPTQVQLSDTEFSVTSPGGFPPGVTIANLLDQSRPRSPVIANAFQRAGLVDRRGKGVNDMFEQQLRAGRDAPDYSRTTPDSVNVSVPLGTADLDMVRFLLTFENQRQRPLSLDELRVVHQVKLFGAATGAELAESSSILPGTLRAIATRLVEGGILEARGHGRTRKYHLTARFYDLAQDRNAYVRIKGIDPLQQERMVIDYVKAFGSISRGQAAELCQMSAEQARHLLKRLVDQGHLRLVGERRTARYVATGHGSWGRQESAGATAEGDASR